MIGSNCLKKWVRIQYNPTASLTITHYRSTIYPPTQEESKPSGSSKDKRPKVLDLQKAKDAQAKEIVALKKRIQRLERKKMSRPTGLKDSRKLVCSRRIGPLTSREGLVVNSKRARMYDLMLKCVLADDERHGAS
ncbi:hypothetical protein Tco_1384389 [Tanacetum coccineum]